jgi:hypothetical protein
VYLLIWPVSGWVALEAAHERYPVEAGFEQHQRIKERSRACSSATSNVENE